MDNGPDLVDDLIAEMENLANNPAEAEQPKSLQIEPKRSKAFAYFSLIYGSLYVSFLYYSNR